MLNDLFSPKDMEGNKGDERERRERHFVKL